MKVHIVLVAHADRTTWVDSVWEELGHAQYRAHRIEAESEWVGADVETHTLVFQPDPSKQNPPEGPK